MKRVRFVRIVHFVWLVPFAVFLVAVRHVGAPHVIWSYDWRGNGKPYSDLGSRHYTRCTYIGWQGSLTEFPGDGRCGWIRFSSKVEKS